MKQHMKNRLFLIIFMIFVLAAGIITNSCTEKTKGDPRILYIRLTDPDKSDSLLAGAFMGDLIAIIGENLGGVEELWFNDQQASLIPTYITDESVIVNIPSTVPEEVTDELTMIFDEGNILTFPFTVNIPAPRIDGVKSEYVPDGESLFLYGDYFFDPITVVFPGDLEATVVSLEKQMLEVTVPESSSMGTINVTTNFGTATSKFIFRDNTNILLDFDEYLHESWTSPIAGADTAVPGPCNGNYTFFMHEGVDEWLWTNELTMQYWAIRGRGNIPVATGNVNDLVFKFEINVPVDWPDVRMEIFFAPYIEDHGRDVAGTSIARWKPWKDGAYKTDGWETITIPLTDFQFSPSDGNNAESGSVPLEDVSDLTNITMMIFGPFETGNSDPFPVFICIDNVRIVPK